MKRVLAVVVVVVTAGVAAHLAFARGHATPLGTGVVIIETNLAYQGAAAAGTGMVLTSSGEVLTNNHVIRGATTIRVEIPKTGRVYTARVLGYAVSDDVALLQLQGASNLKTVSRSSTRLAVGSTVTAIGNAGGGGSLVTATGKIVGLGRSITASDGQGTTERLTGLIETDAGVQAGDSGGPLVDRQGRVVGMTTAASASGGFEFQNVAASDAYAIPIAKALAVADAIEHGRSSATIHVGPTAFLGVEVSELDSYQSVAGALVEGLLPNGPAAKAGVTVGDVITGINGRTVTSPRQVSTIVLAAKPGARVSIRFMDQTGTHTATVTLGSGPPQ